MRWKKREGRNGSIKNGRILEELKSERNTMS